jgi:hypothetical protein
MNESDKAESHISLSEADRFDFTAALKKAFLRYATTDDLVVEFDEDDAPYEPHKGGGFI